MKKIIVMFCLYFPALVILPAQASRGGTMYVAVRTVDLKSSTGFFAAKTGQLEYGAQVTVLQVNGKWSQVRSSANASLSGWTSTTNLSARRVLGGSTTSASANEVALAGKGFNQEVETVYRSEHNLNYADVDRTEAQLVDGQVLRTFLVEGRLSMGDE